MPGPSGISTRTIGLIAAAILTLVFGIIIATSIHSAPITNTNKNLFPPDQSEIPNITDTQTGGEMLVTMVDKQDPTRIAATLKADRFEPIGEGKRRLDNPLSWIYLKDGRRVKITADFATMLMPDPNEPPESGTLEGHIRIETFPASIDPSQAQQEPTMPPTMIAQFDEPVEFERRYLRLRSPGHFAITSTQFDFSGTDLTVILNELRDRVELVDVAQGDQIVIHPKGDPIAPPTKPASQQASSTSTSPVPTNPQRTIDSSPATELAQSNSTPATTNPQTSPSTIPATDPIQTALNLYHIVLHQDVLAAVEGQGSAKADRLELFAALDGSTLPEDSIKPIAFIQTKAQSPTPKPSSSPSRSPSVDSSSSETTPRLNSSASSTQPQTNDIVITWSGPLSVRPIDDSIPDELIDNNLALKLLAEDETAGKAQDRGIEFLMPNRNIRAQAHSATYLATKGQLNLTSKPTPNAIIKIDANDSGSLIASTLNADLSTGVVSMPGRGQMSTTPNDPSEQATIQWKINAEFELDQRDNAISDRLKHAHFDGTVIAKQSGNSIGARTLDAKFDPSKPSAQSLMKLSMVDGVLSSESKSMLSGKAVSIDFIADQYKDSIQPIRFESNGQVFARNTESMLKAEHVVATLYRDMAGKTQVRTADATGDIQYRGVDRTTASGNTLTADGFNETMTLLGSPAKVAQGGSSIVGEQIDLNARHRGIEVVGKGTFDHDIALEENESDDATHTLAGGHIRASWDGSMRFDDAIGSIICQDHVKVISTPDAYTRDTLTAHRAEIKLSPSPTNDRIDKAVSKNKPRELLSARIFGYAPAGQDPKPAKVESRTYAKSDPEKVISLIYLEGSQVLANNQTQTLDVPDAGTLLILDRTELDQDTQNDQTPKKGSGLTRFTWQGKMHLDRANGTASMSDEVLVRQKTIETGEIASLSTDQLDATFDIGSQNNSQSTRLLDAAATGNVRFVYQQRELLADSAIYNAIEDSLFASAVGNKLVTLYEQNDPTPKSARSMKWDLANDRIEINAPTPTRTRTIGG